MSPISAELLLPAAGGRLEPYRAGAVPPVNPKVGPPRTRVAYAAVHVVADPLADIDPVEGPARIDWEATLAFRRHLWSLGLGVAEAMDTAQRGMGLGWEDARALIRRSVAEARAAGGEIACGVGTDQLPDGVPATLDQVRAAYEEQVAVVEEAGGRAVLMASRALAAIATSPDDYLSVYGKVLGQVARPVILHWLGEAFDPALAGYWGCANPVQAIDVVAALCHEHAGHVDGVKVSLLDADLEVALRRRLPDGIRCYTGDDLNYPRLIEGDEQGHSHALLGIFDAIAPVAAAALQALDEEDLPRYRELLDPTVPLARQLFRAPTYHYKTGVVFLAYLNGHQDHFRMVGGRESARSVLHLAELFRLADRAGVLRDPEMAAKRMRPILALAGIGERRR